MAGDLGWQVVGQQAKITRQWWCWVNQQVSIKVSWVEIWSLPWSARKWAKGQANAPFYRGGLLICMDLTCACPPDVYPACCQGPMHMSALGATICMNHVNGQWLAKLTLWPHKGQEIGKKMKSRGSGGDVARKYHNTYSLYDRDLFALDLIGQNATLGYDYLQASVHQVKGNFRSLAFVRK